ncbi:ComEA family DNA-binding protein [Candidatus Roizmanbacteria bacterium]|nr:ComEA family DNA-binding protein [Candidatus Roizmanbacteria bacterium]
MEANELFERYKPLVKQNLLILALGLAGLILFGYGLISFFLSSHSVEEDIVFEAKEENLENISVNLTIDIEGSVVKPGVYLLPLNSRVKDALVIAGGLSANADRDFISKSINLATKLSDGAKIYIPRIGENVTVSTTSIIGSIVSEQININTATEEMLDSLPGVGPATIEKIINGRPYSSINDLLDKKVVGSKVFSDIKEKITAY